MSSDGKDPRDEQSSEPGADSGQEREQPEGSVSREDSVDSPAVADEEPVDELVYEYEYEDEEVGQPEEDQPEDEQSEAPEEESTALTTTEPEPAKTPPPPPPPTSADDEEHEEEGRMSRMSFLDHLGELRTRIMRMLAGVVVIYLAALVFSPELFAIFRTPFEAAYPGVQLAQLTPTEQFYIQYIKLPLLAAVFLGAPWIMLQVWGFISPGLYKRERRYAVPFIFTTALLFILGGLFCYFVALRLALGFLLGLAANAGVQQVISLTSYYDMFFNLHVGMGVVFQMPVVIFFFTLMRITSPEFLLRNSRYAILLIFVAAAIITPTPDVTTMLTFAGPMVLLYYAGIGASYLIVLRRDERKFPWGIFALIVLGLLLLVAAFAFFLVMEMDYQLIQRWPFIVPPGQ
jgi:sec-independent protein translocase protein TatC